MRVCTILLCLFCFISCKKEYNGLNVKNHRKYETAFKEAAQAIVPSEKITFGYHMRSSPFANTSAVSYRFENPEIDLQNDSIAFAKAKLLKELVHSKIGNIKDFTGFNIEFHNVDTMGQGMEDPEPKIFKFNSSD